ncbi:hypothetical protein PRZ48_011340 [Zasmidium cellare]|uniref:Uncharacterized protein n=1 Tax=Zasmidium cellare TaxID=395010 RepID=A0ABR0E645_ZASCE|nr:hypothetical protein PRZ48_011340 [Zasmidium cellare]
MPSHPPTIYNYGSYNEGYRPNAPQPSRKRGRSPESAPLKPRKAQKPSINPTHMSKGIRQKRQRWVWERDADPDNFVLPEFPSEAEEAYFDAYVEKMGAYGSTAKPLRKRRQQTSRPESLSRSSAPTPTPPVRDEEKERLQLNNQRLEAELRKGKEQASQLQLGHERKNEEREKDEAKRDLSQSTSGRMQSRGRSFTPRKHSTFRFTDGSSGRRSQSTVLRDLDESLNDMNAGVAQSVKNGQGMMLVGEAMHKFQSGNGDVAMMDDQELANTGAQLKARAALAKEGPSLTDMGARIKARAIKRVAPTTIRTSRTGWGQRLLFPKQLRTWRLALKLVAAMLRREGTTSTPKTM